MKLKNINFLVDLVNIGGLDAWIRIVKIPLDSGDDFRPL